MLRAGAVTFWQIVIFPMNIFADGARPFHPLAVSSTPKDQIFLALPNHHFAHTPSLNQGRCHPRHFLGSFLSYLWVD